MPFNLYFHIESGVKIFFKEYLTHPVLNDFLSSCLFIIYDFSLSLYVACLSILWRSFFIIITIIIFLLYVESLPFIWGLSRISWEKLLYAMKMKCLREQYNVYFMDRLPSCHITLLMCYYNLHICFPVVCIFTCA